MFPQNTVYLFSIFAEPEETLENIYRQYSQSQCRLFDMDICGDAGHLLCEPYAKVSRRSSMLGVNVRSTYSAHGRTSLGTSISVAVPVAGVTTDIRAVSLRHVLNLKGCGNAFGNV